jgi:hypothetical protein
MEVSGQLYARTNRQNISCFVQQMSSNCHKIYKDHDTGTEIRVALKRAVVILLTQIGQSLQQKEVRIDRTKIRVTGATVCIGKMP